MTTYADSSFLVSLYAPDVNSAAAARYLQTSKDDLILTTFAEVEVVNALELRVFRHELTDGEVAQALTAFDSDIRGGVFTAAPTPAATFQQAIELSHRHTPAMGTRSLDILHVAAALVLRAQAFLTFDRRQQKLAKAAGLVTPIRIR